MADARNDLEKHGYLPVCRYASIEFLTKEYATLFLEAMQFDWECPAPRNFVLDGRQTVEATLSDSKITERDKGAALGFAIHKSTDAVCSTLLKFNADPRLCMKQFLRRLRSSHGKEVVMKRMLRLPREANNIAPWTDEERNAFLEALRVGDSSTLLKAAPSLLFDKDKEALAKEKFSEIVTELVMRTRARNKPRFQGSVAEAVTGLLWSVGFVPSPKTVVYEGVEYTCLVTAVAANDHLAGQLQWLCQSQKVRDRAITVRDSPHTDPAVQDVLRKCNIESITVSETEEPFRAIRDHKAGSGQSGLAVRHERSIPTDRFVPKHDRHGLRKPERVELTYAWPVINEEMKSFVNLDDPDFVIKFMDLFESTRVDCEPDLSGTLTANPHGWKLATPTGLGPVSAAGTRVFFENKIKVNSQTIDMAVGELLRIAFHVRRDSQTWQMNHEIPLVLVLAVPEDPGAHQRLYLETNGINVHVNANMKVKHSTKRKAMG